MDGNEDLVEVVLVPVEVFGANEGYGLMDSVCPWSDCNRAIGHIYRREERSDVQFPNPDDVIKIYVTHSELAKFDRNNRE